MQVAVLRGFPVYQVTDTKLYGNYHLNSKVDDRSVEFLTSAATSVIMTSKLWLICLDPECCMYLSPVLYSKALPCSRNTQGSQVHTANAMRLQRDWTPAYCRIVELIEDATDPSIFGQRFYYSYGTDVTLTQQRWTSLQEAGEGHKPQWASADRRFFWNKFLTQPLIGAAA